MWSSRIRAVTDELPQMNHYLLDKYHGESIARIPAMLEYLFKQSVQVINANVTEELNFKYLSYRELSPTERVSLFRDENNSFEKSFSIRRTRRRVLAFMFEYLGERYEMKVDVPYIFNRSILLDGNTYFPLFAISDRGGLCRRDDTIILQVLRTKLIFKREKMTRFKTVEGDMYRECIITAKIHQGKKGRKKSPPIVLHHLTSCGFLKTMQMYGMQDIISIVPTADPVEGYCHVEIRFGVYLRVLKKAMDSKVKRVILGLIDIFTYYTDFTIDDLQHRGYYVLATGAWAQAKMKDRRELDKHAREYLKMNESLLDPVSMIQHASVGIMYQNLDELLMYVFNNIDALIVDYMKNSTNMLDKRIAGADLLMSLIIKNFNSSIFEILNASPDNKSKTIKRLMYHRRFAKSVTGSDLFRVASSLYSDNALAVIGNRLLTLSNIEVPGGGEKRSKSRTVPTFLLRVHYSYPIVCSLFTYPSSSPIVGGSINPFVQITEFGDIIKPPFLEDLRNVYGE